MANRKIVTGLLTVIALISLFPTIVLGSTDTDAIQTVKSYDSVQPTKEWTIEFNTEMDDESINNQTIYVEDSNQNKIPATVYLTDDKRKAKVIPPNGGYAAGETYKLTVTGQVYSTDKLLIKQGYAIEFTIEAKEVASDKSVVSFGVVTADILNVRGGPSTSSEKLGKLEYGDVVEIYSFDGSWAKIEYNGQDAYLHKDYLKLKSVSGATVIEGLNVVIDAGHGGQDPGALKNDLQEKDLNLDVSLKVADKLKELGANPILTRSTDEFLELYERVKYSNNNLGDIFVSIHVNSAVSTASGAEVYYNEGKGLNEMESILLAQKIQDQLVELVDMHDRGIKQGDFYVIRENETPAALVELGFITNDDDRKKLESDEYRTLFAEAITQGIVDYFKEAVN
ncbi:N-acetylmuramoyl-L-alanine amidase [Aquibacillus salsiterrae]|uniref:N-acetylmuramoyl-L-alanine amidase n=1 Tax=Aquibacillus salsiterrae TaxID=2950439 RepID=A0A9X3WDJ4_9BACI|nr:N-acetylmuramoyl-L-alanine amidase [Aquibacillus salsiterrae]MDC3416115.1 N-acetylmuramoyl-L-alanine amidase [Aquibacillus salsiterrae]